MVPTEAGSDGLHRRVERRIELLVVRRHRGVGDLQCHRETSVVGSSDDNRHRLLVTGRPPKITAPQDVERICGESVFRLELPVDRAAGIVSASRAGSL